MRGDLRRRGRREARCGECGAGYPQMELRGFRRRSPVHLQPSGAPGDRVHLCLRCAVGAIEDDSIFADPSAEARILELIAACLARPTWGETTASRQQRWRARDYDHVLEQLRALHGTGGAA